MARSTVSAVSASSICSFAAEHSAASSCNSSCIKGSFRTAWESGSHGASEVRRWLGREPGVVETPHSQRRVAPVLTRLTNDTSDLPLTHLIDLVEEALQTPVQTAVKREDEQEFARRNGENLMFCEDAARRIKDALNDDESIEDFWGRVDHMESLHPHDAASVFTKGVKGGYLPIP